MQYYIILWSLLLCIYIITQDYRYTKTPHVASCMGRMLLNHVSRFSQQQQVAASIGCIIHQASMHTLCGSHPKCALYPERALCPRWCALCLEHEAHFGWVHVGWTRTTRTRSAQEVMQTLSPRNTFPPRDGQWYSRTTRAQRRL